MSSERPVHACTHIRMLLRNIIAVIRWNWGSPALTRVLEPPPDTRDLLLERRALSLSFSASPLRFRSEESQRVPSEFLFLDRATPTSLFHAANVRRDSVCVCVCVCVFAFLQDDLRRRRTPKMWLQKLWPCLVLMVLWAGSVQRVSACSCMISHPQTLYCRSDFVAVVRVKKEYVNEHEVEYKVIYHKVFKSSPEFEKIKEQGSIRTGSHSAMCGVSLNVGDTYIVGGQAIDGKARISLCGLHAKWSEVSNRQRKGFRRLYRHGCACEIQYTPWTRKGAVFDSVGGKRCLWESVPGPWECQREYGVCMLSPAGCSWKTSTAYKTCIKEHQRQREQQRLKEP